MTLIRNEDVIQSVADALQYISYYHPIDFITAVNEAYEREESLAAKDAMAQILINSRMCAEGKRPICQDTGIVTVFLKVGMSVQWEGDMALEDMVNEGVRRAYLNPDNVLRASILSDPAGARKNTKDNTPAVIHTQIVPGSEIDVKVAAKGGGSENKAKLAMLNPSDSIVDWVEKTLPNMGAGWCPPGMLGIGIGGTAEKAAVLAKESLMDPIDIHELRAKGASNRIEELRLEIMGRANSLGIGAQGLGGLTTVLDVKILDFPTHAASLPVAMIPNCAATRHAHFTLDGNGIADFEPPSLDLWPEITWDVGPRARKVNLDTLTPEAITSWEPGETLLLSGTMLTGRDAAHKRLLAMLAVPAARCCPSRGAASSTTAPPPWEAAPPPAAAASSRQRAARGRSARARSRPPPIASPSPCATPSPQSCAQPQPQPLTPSRKPHLALTSPRPGAPHGERQGGDHRGGRHHLRGARPRGVHC